MNNFLSKNAGSPFLPKGWSADLWSKFWDVASKMSRQELVVVWLCSRAGSVSEESFNRNLQDMQNFSKEELLDIIDEIDPKTAEQVIKQYSCHVAHP